MSGHILRSETHCQFCMPPIQRVLREIRVLLYITRARGFSCVEVDFCLMYISFVHPFTPIIACLPTNRTYAIHFGVRAENPKVKDIDDYLYEMSYSSARAWLNRNRGLLNDPQRPTSITQTTIAYSDNGTNLIAQVGKAIPQNPPKTGLSPRKFSVLC